MTQQFIITCFSFLISISAIAQVDTTYIEKLPAKKVFGVHTTLKKFRVSFNTPVSEQINFQAQNWGIGFRFKYKKIGVSISVPILAINPSLLGTPKNYGFSFGIYPSSFFIYGHCRYFNGLNDLNALQETPDRAFREDMNMLFVYLTGNYILNSKKYSLRSALKMLDRQRRSAGSFLLSSVIEFQSFNADSLSLPISNQQNFILDAYQSYKFGIGGGYAHTFVWKNWSATGMITGGAEFRRLNYQLADDFNRVQKFVVSPQLRLFGSLLYNKNDFFYGLTGSYIPGLSVLNELNARLLIWRLRLTIGWRFK